MVAEVVLMAIMTQVHQKKLLVNDRFHSVHMQCNYFSFLQCCYIYITLTDFVVLIVVN